jgi:hypothetical protein
LLASESRFNFHPRMQDWVTRFFRRYLIGFDFRYISILVAMFLVTLFLWDTVIIHPFKVFVVMVHELSHGVAALATGGGISHIEIEPSLGGVCYTYGGIWWIILSAGYTGSMLVGALLLLLASKTRLDKPISIVLGSILLWLTIRYVANDYGQVFGFLGGSGLILLGIWGSMVLNELLLQYVGLTSMLYAVIDVYDDTIARRFDTSDAGLFADLTGLSSTFWGAVWMLFSILIGGFILWRTVRTAPSRHPGNLPRPQASGTATTGTAT